MKAKISLAAAALQQRRQQQQSALAYGWRQPASGISGGGRRGENVSNRNVAISAISIES